MSHSSYRSTYNRTAQISQPRRLNAHGNGRRTACSSTSPSHGSACARYVPCTTNTDEFHANATQGGEKYQSAFYVFEELAQTSQSQSPHSLVAQAVSELHLGRLPEAEAALQQAIEIDPKSADTIANLIVLNTLLGKKEETAQLKQQLESTNAEHRAVKDWAEKKSDFQKAAAKYTPKFEVAA